MKRAAAPAGAALAVAQSGPKVPRLDELVAAYERKHGCDHSGEKCPHCTDGDEFDDRCPYCKRWCAICQTCGVSQSLYQELLTNDSYLCHYLLTQKAQTKRNAP